LPAEIIVARKPAMLGPSGSPIYAPALELASSHSHVARLDIIDGAMEGTIRGCTPKSQ